MFTIPAFFKKPAFVLAVVGLVAVATAAISTTLALRAPEEAPRVSLWVSSGTHERIEPVRYCDIELQGCLVMLGSTQPARITVGEQDRVLVSVPEEASKGWLLDLVWFRQTSEGVQVDYPQPQRFLNREEPVFSTWIEPRGDGWRLRSLAVEVPSTVLAPNQSAILWSAIWLACAEDCSLAQDPAAQ